jgi:hypothetical protein
MREGASSIALHREASGLGTTRSLLCRGGVFVRFENYRSDQRACAGKDVSGRASYNFETLKFKTGFLFVFPLYSEQEQQLSFYPRLCLYVLQSGNRTQQK